MLQQFMNVWLQVLIHKSHDLLADEIQVALYHMASSDFNLFFTHILPSFVLSADGLQPAQKEALAGNFRREEVSLNMGMVPVLDSCRIRFCLFLMCEAGVLAWPTCSGVSSNL